MNDTLNNMLQSYGVNPCMKNAVESYIKELEGGIAKDSTLISDLNDSLFAARQSVLTEGLLAEKLNDENVALREEVSKLKVELGRITTFLLMPK